MNEHETILIADDEEDDIVLFKRSLQDVGVLNQTITVRSGLEVIDYLSGRKQFENRAAFPLPIIVFIDAKMPVHNCFDVLIWIREQGEMLPEIPIVVVSGSSNPAEQMRALELGAKAFYHKPLEGVELIKCLNLVLPGKVVIPDDESSSSVQPTNKVERSARES